jgi:hypothetical protein
MLLVATAVAIWWGLEQSEPRAEWLRVEAPHRAVAGQRLLMRVHLAPLAEPTVVGVDLHWGTSRDFSVGYLASGGTQAAGKAGGTFEFEIPVTPKPGLRFVTGIIFLSRTGTWSDHTLVAATEVIPVSSAPGDQSERRLEPLRVEPLGDRESGHSHPAALPRLLTALLFLAAAMGAWGVARSGEASRGAPVAKQRWWLALTVALALVCVWELLGLETWLDTQARAMARTEDLYYPRAVFQRVVVSLALAVVPLILLYVRRIRRSHRLLFTSLALYLVITAVNLVSLHVIDQVAGLAWHGLTLVQALKLTCAALVVRGVRRAGGPPEPPGGVSHPPERQELSSRRPASRS